LIRAEVNVAAALRRFTTLADSARDRTQPNRQLATQLTGWVLRNFQQGGGMQTPSWAPLKPSTAKRKARLGYSSTPLIRKGHLRQSFRPFYTSDEAGTGSEVPYSQFHETGTQHLPQRAMLPNQTVALDYAVRIYTLWAEKLARSA